MYALGIDLGTTFTAAAIWRNGYAEIVTLGSRTAAVPTVVLLRSDETFLTGEPANRRGVTEPHRLAREFKRRLGDTTPILLGGAPYSAEALMGKVLRWVVEEVSRREGQPPATICVSHPANWGAYKTDLLRQAVRLADIEYPVTLTTEPEAAAASYAQAQRLEPGAIVAVYDLGGGTFDAAVLRRTPTGFETLGQPEGIERLGGIDFDAAVFDHVSRALGGLLQTLDEDDPATIAAVGRLRQECVEAKETLSEDTDVTIPVLLPSTSTEVRLTRAELEAMVRPALQTSIEALRRALRSAQVTPEQLHSVLLVGGSSRMPVVAQLVGAELGRPVAVDAHPKHAIALGAAWQASASITGGPAGQAPPATGPVLATASVPTLQNQPSPYSVPPTGPPTGALPPPTAPFGAGSFGAAPPGPGSFGATAPGAGSFGANPTGPSSLPTDPTELSPAALPPTGPLPTGPPPAGPPSAGPPSAGPPPFGPGIFGTEPTELGPTVAGPDRTTAQPQGVPPQGAPRQGGPPQGDPRQGVPPLPKATTVGSASVAPASLASPPPGAGPPGPGAFGVTPSEGSPTLPPSSSGYPSAPERTELLRTTGSEPPGPAGASFGPALPGTVSGLGSRPTGPGGGGPGLAGAGGPADPTAFGAPGQSLPAVPRGAESGPNGPRHSGSAARSPLRRLAPALLIFAAVLVLVTVIGVTFFRSDGTGGNAGNNQAQTPPPVPPDEQCTDEIKRNPRWVCLTSATIANGLLSVEYQVEYAGSTPSLTGFHLHIYGSDGSVARDETMGTQFRNPGVWFNEDKNPSVHRVTDQVVIDTLGDFPKVCSRMATTGHRLVPDTTGKTFKTGNCVPLKRN